MRIVKITEEISLQIVDDSEDSEIANRDWKIGTVVYSTLLKREGVIEKEFTREDGGFYLIRFKTEGYRRVYKYSASLELAGEQ